MTRTTIQIDLNALDENYATLRDKVPSHAKMLCVVKADAYGHGAIPVAQRLEAAGTDYFGVAAIEEGIELRDNGISKPILVMGGVMPWDDMTALHNHRLTPVIADFGGLGTLARYAKKSGAVVKAHVKVDTGMGRLGFAPDELNALARALKAATYVEVEGLMSHFASSEQRDTYGLSQIARFNDAASFLREQGIEPKVLHMANSGALCQYPEAHFDMVRLGILLYGSYPDKSLADRIRVRSVMKLASHIAYIKVFPPSSALSYGRTFVTKQETRVAFIAAGYADGVPRALSNKSSVLIRGQRCPIVGRVCMDWLLADVTSLPDAGAGEEAVIMGSTGSESITADEIAAHANTIPYEILCGMSRRIPRFYV